MSTSVSLVNQSSAYMVTTELQSAHEIPQMCRKLAEILNERPLFDGKVTVTEKVKVISLAKWADARICAIFSANSLKFLGEKRAWHIRDFGSGNHQVQDANHQLIQLGIYLELYDQYERCSLEELEQAYNRVFSSMATGWEKAKIEDPTDVPIQRNPEEFELFVKSEDKALGEEDALIRFIAKSLSLADDIECHTKRQATSQGRFYNGTTYLWVRKSALATVREKLGLQL